MSDSRRRVAAVSGVGASALSFGGITLAVALAPWFSLTDNALSDLGVADSAAVAVAFNWGLMLAGLVALPYAWALWTAAGDHVTGRLDRLLARAVAVGFALASLLMSAVGVFPSGDPLHFPVAAGFYLLLTAVVGVDGLRRVRTTTGKAAVAGAVGHLGQWWLYVEGVRLGPGLAIPELVGAGLLVAWVVAGSPVAPLGQSAT